MAGAIAITSIYYVGSASSHHFQEQQRIATTQMSLRMGVEQLRRDLSRAGYMGSPDSRREIRCMTPNREIQGIEFANATDLGALPNAAENGVTADRLRLVGNYLTSDSYLAIGLNGGGTRVFLQRSWQGFRRSFGEPFSAAAFTDVFVAGRMLHIRTLQGQHFFVTITGADAGQAAVDFSPALPVGSVCLAGLADGAMVAPLARIEYRVLQLGRRTEGSQLGRVTGEDFLGETNPQLIRHEIAFNDNSWLPGTERVVLEYVANFDVRFMIDTAANPGAAPNLVEVAEGQAQNQMGFGRRPNRARSAIVDVSVRTPEQDPNYLWPFPGARPANAPLTHYRVNGALPGAARVRTVRTEILLPNIANRMIRP